MLGLCWDAAEPRSNWDDGECDFLQHSTYGKFHFQTLGRLEQLKLEMWSSVGMWWSKMWAWPEYLYWNHIASKWLFPEQVGYNVVLYLNAPPGQIPSTSWRVRTLQACCHGIMWPGSIGGCVELQLVTNSRQPCGGLWSQRWLHDLSAPLLLHNPSSAAVLLSCVAVLAGLASSVWPGTCRCRSQLFTLWSFQALVMVACGVVWEGDSVPKWTEQWLLFLRNQEVRVLSNHSLCCCWLGTRFFSILYLSFPICKALVFFLNWDLSMWSAV